MVLLSFPMLASAPESGNGAPMVITDGKLEAALVEATWDVVLVEEATDVVLEVIGVEVEVGVLFELLLT